MKSKSNYSKLFGAFSLTFLGDGLTLGCRTLACLHPNNGYVICIHYDDCPAITLADF